MTITDISEATFNRFQSVKSMGNDDDILNRLLDDHEAVEKHIKEYLKGRDECIDEIILGRRVIANHYFEDGVCTKCGAVHDGIRRI